jgi:hypothetical protein
MKEAENTQWNSVKGQHEQTNKNWNKRRRWGWPSKGAAAARLAKTRRNSLGLELGVGWHKTIEKGAGERARKAPPRTCKREKDGKTSLDLSWFPVETKTKIQTNEDRAPNSKSRLRREQIQFHHGVFASWWEQSFLIQCWPNILER